MAAEGLPRLVQLSEGDLNEQDDRLGRAEARIVKLGAETASIPNLHFLEEQVAGVRA